MMNVQNKKSEKLLKETNEEKKRAISIIADEIIKKRLVIFVGAGCSVSAGLPSWKELISKLLQTHQIKTKDDNLIRLATRLESDLGSLRFRENIIENLRSKPTIKSSLHDTLVSLDLNLFITTNYDHLLEDTFNKKGYLPQIIWQDKDLPSIDPTKKVIVKLHGDINSPTSLVATSRDYTKYKSEHNAFVEWLNFTISQNTIVFLGTSFDDPRLKESDEHVLSLFGEFRRQPFIFLRLPTRDTSTYDEDFEIELEDFQALCEDFKGRGFFVILIEQYDEINAILQEIHRRVLSAKLQAEPLDIETKLILQSDYSGSLEQNLQKLLDKKTLELSEHVRGKGRLPTSSLMIERAEALIQHLENPPAPLSQESQMEGLLTVADALLNSDKRQDILRSRKYYERANVVFQSIPDQEKWKERLIRVRAKLLFFEGKIDEAIESISNSNDNKTISTWLALLIDSNRFEEAYNFLSTREIHASWVCEALYILITTGRVQQAQEIFQKTIAENDSLKKRGEIKDSPFKGTFFYEKLCFTMAQALYNRGVRLTGKEEFSRIFPGQLTSEGVKLCRESLKYIDLLFAQASRQNLDENHFAAFAVRTEMSAAYLLGMWQRADSAVKNLIPVKPIQKEVINYIVSHPSPFDSHFLKTTVQRLSEDHPEKTWAILRIAIIEALYLKNSEKSWASIHKAVSLATSLDEKAEVAETTLNLGQSTNRVDEAMAIVNDLLPADDLRRKLLEARYHHEKRTTDSAEQLFKEIEKQNPPPDMAAELNLMRAEHAIKEEKWEEARYLLERSKNLAFNPLTLNRLLYVLVKLEDDVEALKLSEQIESIRPDDWEAIHIKAQTARNLGQFKKSEKAWRTLRKKFPEKAEFAFGLADVLVWRDKFKPALKTLAPFIKCDDNTNINCLGLACEIHQINEDYAKSFDLLENCYSQIENEPALLLMHMGLAFRTGHEEDANRSLLRLEVLRQEGKVAEEAFSRVPIDEVREMFKKRRESTEKKQELYRLGQLPRILLSEHRNMPLYLDWAVKTQELVLSSNPEEWLDYTIYSTNGMRVEIARGRSQLIPIRAPDDVSEIVIDYHALITIHRLGLLEKLNNRYSKVYYPDVLKIIWAIDQRRFGHHQLSKEKAYRNLNERLQTRQIRELVAPDPPDNSEFQADTYMKRNYRLAKLEGFPLLDAYSEKEELVAFADVTVLRLFQVIEWLYQKGKISEREFQNLREISKGPSAIVKEHVTSILDNANQLLIEETTLEVMEENGLIQLLLDVGTQVHVERGSANFIKNAVLELDFGKKVGIWHRDLAESVKKLNFFKEISADLDHKDRSFFHSPHDEAAFSPIKYAEDRGLFLLTDDRWTQMIRTKNMINKQFGTDALLTDLYDKGLINIEEYANCLLDLCKWRYRFLIPDSRILFFFAKEYKQSPLGRPLNIIADYGRKCMEDPGLFWGPEQTEPPLPLGIKFQMAWTSEWIKLLVDVWQDDEFINQNCMQITKKVYQQALPDLPKGVKDEIRRNYATVYPKSIIQQLLISAFNDKELMKLEGLIKQTFDIFNYDEKKRVAELNSHLEFIKDRFGKDNKELLRSLIIRTLKAFYGKGVFGPIDPSLVPLLTEVGILKKNEQTISSKIKIEEKPGEYGLGDLPDLITTRKKLPEYIPRGPLIIVPPSEEKRGTILIPHDIIQAPSRDVRIAAIEYILDHENVSGFTKKLIEKKSKEIKSGDLTIWHPAANEAAYDLKKDFKYAKSLFAQAPKIPALEEQIANRIIEEAWANATTPDLNTVFDEMPLIVRNPFEKEAIKRRVETEIIEKVSIAENTGQDLLLEIFDWYLKNVFLFQQHRR